MHKTTKVRSIGGSLGTIIPREILEEMHIQNGDELLVVKTEQGILLTPYDPDFDAAMAAFEQGRRKYRNALRELSK